MKLIVAIIVPERLEPVREALSRIEVSGMTVSDARGFGRQKGIRETYRGTEYEVAFVPKLRLEIGVSDSFCEKAVAAIAEAADTGAIGAGKIFVQPLEDAIRIRTGERGEPAL